MTGSTETPRSRRRQARVDAILDAALGVMVSEGAEALTMLRLAEVLDYTPGAFYRYFPSKDAIVAALQVRLLGQLLRTFQAGWAALSAARGDLEQPALAELLAAVRIYAALPSANPAVFGLLHLGLADPRELLSSDDAKPVAAALAELLASLAQRLSASVGEGAFRPERALVLWGAVHGQLMLRKFNRFRPDLFDGASLSRLAVDGLLSGWGVSRESLEAAWTAVDFVCTQPAMAEWIGRHLGSVSRLES